MGRKDKAKIKIKRKDGNKEKEEGKLSARDSIAATGSRNMKEVKVITDPRFSSANSDPRFQRVPNQQSKVSIDSRFSNALEKNFSSSSAPVDKRGKRKNVKSENPLRHYYRLDEEENKKKDQESDDGDENGESEKSEKAKVQKHDSNTVESDSNSEYEESESADELSDDTSSSTGSDTDVDDGGYLEDEPEEPEENIPVTEQETRRLAIVNMDWSQVRAADLFVVMSSFLPKSGKIMSVAVYPSEFGLKRMEEEAVKGPVGLFDDDKVKSDDDDDSNDVIDEEKLRAYEKSRLRYYYAVVVCDSSHTADYLYKNCDDIEFERTSNVLDMRFIPDSMEFKHPPRDIATEAPANYEGIDFQTRALQHSNIEITWDEDEPHRSKALKQTFNADQLAESVVNPYVATDVSDDDDDDDQDDVQDDQSKGKLTKEEKYQLLLGRGDEGSDGGDDEDVNKDMEVTFNTGLEDLSKRILEKKKDKDSETVWNLYLKKKSEKKKARKDASKHSSEDESSGSGRDEAEQDDFFIDESSIKLSKRGKGNRKEHQPEDTEKEHEASKAELELLLADDQEANNSVKGYNIKRNKAKGKRGKKEDPSEDKIPAVDYTDPRFENLFKSSLFALDPTDPQYKRSAAYARQVVAQKQNGVSGDLGNGEELTPQAQLASDNTVPGKKVIDDLKYEEMPTSKKEKFELSSLVRSIKRKSQQAAQIPYKRSRKNSESKPRGKSSNDKENNGLSSMVQSIKSKIKQ